jgi:hypothetical protein
VIEHLGVGVDAETAEGEGDPAGGRVGFEGSSGVESMALAGRGDDPMA